MIRVGTRGSALALAQARIVADALGTEAELVVVRTAGDETARPLRELGDGVFVSAIEDRLRAREIDVAVHSLKDLPTAQTPGLAVAAIPRREDPRDVLVTRGRLGLAGLGAGARVGTSSPRRAAFVSALVGGVVPSEIRGNVDTRLRKVRDGEYDAAIVAAAGLRRLGIAFGEHEALPIEDCPPAPGQGALAVQTRDGDPLAARLHAALDDPATRAAVTAEREVLRLLGASCALALGCHARAGDGTLVLVAALVTDGAMRRAHVSGSDPLRVARDAAAQLEAAHVG